MGFRRSSGVVIVALFTMALALAMTGSAWAASAPLIGNTWSSHVGMKNATLNASIDPGGLESTYHFEYGPTSAYGSSVPIPDASIGAGEEALIVSQPIGNLEGGSSYHYRIVASNADGTTYGPDKALKTYPVPVSETDSCPNAAIRAAQASQYLPDCRAYEMVSPQDKNDGNVSAASSETQSSVSGDAVKYTSTTMFADALGAEPMGAEYVSHRTPAGWTTHGVNPVQYNTRNIGFYMTSEYLYFSEDLSKGVYMAFSPVLPGYSNVESVPNLYLRTDVLSGPPGNYELLSDAVSPVPSREGNELSGIVFAAASADWKHILFETVANLTPDSLSLDPSLPKVYEWHDGTVKLMGILPNGEPAGKSVAGAGAGAALVYPEDHGTWTQNTMSADGSRIIFTVPTENKPDRQAGNLYMRINGTETVQLSAGGSAEFWKATPDDSKVAFTEGGTAFIYNIDAPPSERLTLVAPSEGQGVAINGISDDGSYVYFSRASVAYVWHDGVTRPIVPRQAYTERSSCCESWGEGSYVYSDAFRISPDGKTAIFSDNAPEAAEKAGYDNPPFDRENVSGSLAGGHSEIFVYHYDTDKLECASCNPSGAAPVSEAGFSADEYKDADARYPLSAFTITMYLDRPLSSDGRYAFFDTEDALVPQDINGRRDVYEYDTVTQEVHLITSGTCDCSSEFADASPDGSNVFFVTRQKLVRADIDGGEGDLYDARIAGGIPSQNQPSSAACEGDDCQGPAAQTPGVSLPASLTFNGVGNPQGAQQETHVALKRHVAVRRHKARHRKRHRRGRKARRSMSGSRR